MTTRIYDDQYHRFSQRRLWFGVIAAPAAWVLHGLLAFFVSSQACRDGDPDWGSLSGTAVQWLLGLLTVGLLAIGIAGAIVSFQNWHALSANHDITHAEGRGRVEFLAASGFFVAIAMLVGIVWFGLPLVMVNLCTRGH